MVLYLLKRRVPFCRSVQLTDCRWHASTSFIRLRRVEMIERPFRFALCRKNANRGHFKLIFSSLENDAQHIKVVVFLQPFLFSSLLFSFFSSFSTHCYWILRSFCLSSNAQVLPLLFMRRCECVFSQFFCTF